MDEEWNTDGTEKDCHCEARNNSLPRLLGEAIPKLKE
jgi:hypothetical protein